MESVEKMGRENEVKKERNFRVFLLLFTAALAIVYYQGMFCWDMLGFLGYAASLLVFGFACIRQTKEEWKEAERYLLCFLLLFAVPIFSGVDYFGSPQMYVMIPGLLILAVLTVKRRKKWILPVSFVFSAAVVLFPSDAAEGAELAVFAFLMLPYLGIAAVFFVRLLRDNRSCLRYWFWLLGSVLLPVAFFVPGGAGNVAFSVVFFDLTTTLALIAADEAAVKRAAEGPALWVCRLGPAGLLLLIYPVLLQPLGEETLSRLGGQVIRFFIS